MHYFLITWCNKLRFLIHLACITFWLPDVTSSGFLLWMFEIAIRCETKSSLLSKSAKHFWCFSNRQTERFSNSYWKLIYSLQNPNLEFEAVVLEKIERGRLTVSRANLVRTNKLSESGKYELNDVLKSQNTSVNLVTQEAFFKVIK